MDDGIQAGSPRRPPRSVSNDLPDLVLLIGCVGTVLLGAFFWLMASSAPVGPAPAAVALALPDLPLPFDPPLSPEQEKAVAKIWQRGGRVVFDQEGPFFVTFPADTKDRHLEALKQFPKLKWLELSDTAITDNGLKRLQGLTEQLEALYLRQTKITDRGLEYLKGLPKLYVLDLDGCAITDDGVKHLAGLTNLRVLELSRGRITDEGLRHLQPLVGLRELSVNDTAVTAAGLDHLQGLKELRVLYLSSLNIGGEGLKKLHSFPHLKRLHLSEAKLTDADLTHLVGLNELYTLYLSNNQTADQKGLTNVITDQGMIHLAKLPKLASLSLARTAVTDAGLVRLRGLAELTDLDLEQTQVTDDGVRQLQQALPQVRVRR